MEILIFIPALVCIAGLVYWGPAKTLLNICLPALLLLPTYFYWKIEGFPAIGSDISVLMPLSVAMIPLCARWRFSRADLWIGAYILSSAYADFRVGEASLARYRLFNVIFTALVPYMAGKLLIEQAGERLAIVKRIVLVLFISCIFSIPESFLRLNLFMRGGMHLFPNQWPGWYTQIRYGFGRVAGPYGSAELYGMALMVALLLMLWLRKWPGGTEVSAPRSWPHSKILTLLMSAVLLVTLAMTGSRGPWLGMVPGLLIASLGRAKRLGRTAALVGAFSMLIALPSYELAKNYVTGPREHYGTERETAQYRSEMIQNYLPLARKGGLWGWGTFHPIVHNQVSIDNEFLRVFLVQGYVGLVAYVLLAFEGAYILLRVGLSTQSRRERHFCFTMLGILIGWIFTLSTVYMGAQTCEIFFLLVGWTQALSPARARSMAPEQTALYDEIEALPLNRIYT